MKITLKHLYWDDPKRIVIIIFMIDFFIRLLFLNNIIAVVLSYGSWVYHYPSIVNQVGLIMAQPVGLVVGVFLIWGMISILDDVWSRRIMRTSAFIGTCSLLFLFGTTAYSYLAVSGVVTTSPKKVPEVKGNRSLSAIFFVLIMLSITSVDQITSGLKDPTGGNNPLEVYQEAAEQSVEAFQVDDTSLDPRRWSKEKLYAEYQRAYQEGRLGNAEQLGLILAGKERKYFPKEHDPIIKEKTLFIVYRDNTAFAEVVPRIIQEIENHISVESMVFPSNTDGMEIYNWIQANKHRFVGNYYWSDETCDTYHLPENKDIITLRYIDSVVRFLYERRTDINRIESIRQPGLTTDEIAQIEFDLLRDLIGRFNFAPERLIVFGEKIADHSPSYRVRHDTYRRILENIFREMYPGIEVIDASSYSIYDLNREGYLADPQTLVVFDRHERHVWVTNAFDYLLTPEYGVVEIPFENILDALMMREGNIPLWQDEEILPQVLVYLLNVYSAHTSEHYLHQQILIEYLATRIRN